jgi:hypothetical protein
MFGSIGQLICQITDAELSSQGILRNDSEMPVIQQQGGGLKELFVYFGGLGGCGHSCPCRQCPIGQQGGSQPCGFVQPLKCTPIPSLALLPLQSKYYKGRNTIID